LTRHHQTATRADGFTLLEVLVVVFIIGIVLSFAVISIRDNPSDRVETEVRRFATLVTLAAQEAVLQSREIAVEVGDESYRFLVLEENAWVESNDELLRARTLPEGMRITISVEGERGKDNGMKTKTDPRIYLLSGGEMTPFQFLITLDAARVSYGVSGDALGRLEFGG
jgi:general secretion pathway protein H